MGSEPIQQSIIRYSGLYDFDGMYAAIIDWAKNYGFRWHEVDYKHKVPSPDGAEQEWKWAMTKEVNDFINYYYELKVHMWDMQEVEVEIDGKKKTLTKGRIYIWVDGKMTFDWQERFKGGRFKEWMGAFYRKAKDPEISEYWDTIKYRGLQLNALIKKYFDMQAKHNSHVVYLKEN
jgi:hypothetical protein